MDFSEIQALVAYLYLMKADIYGYDKDACMLERKKKQGWGYDSKRGVGGRGHVGK